MRTYERPGVVVVALGGLLLMSWGGVAGAEMADPTRIVQKAVTKITSLSVERVQVNERTAAACVAQIQELLAEGKKAQATTIANTTIKAIQDWSVDTVKNIRSVSKAAVRAVLAARGTPEQVKQIQTAADTGVKAVQDSATAAVTEINDALASG